MSKAEKKVFEIIDIRKYIFKFIRKEPKIKCTECNSVLVWDNKVKDFINIRVNSTFFNIPKGDYCLACYSSKTKLNCIIT